MDTNANTDGKEHGKHFAYHIRNAKKLDGTLRFPAVKLERPKHG